jgi:DNA-directed RNA polymerase subunit RPC12/RpoP
MKHPCDAIRSWRPRPYAQSNIERKMRLREYYCNRCMLTLPDSEVAVDAVCRTCGDRVNLRYIANWRVQTGNS